MAKFPKTRILVGDEVRFSELLSLKEGTDGTVTIVPKSGYRMVTKNTPSKIKSEHISVHPSKISVSKSTTIKNTILLEDEEIISVASIENSQEELVWPIYTKCTAELTNDDFHYDRDRESEIKMVIAEKIDSNFPMLYSVLVQRKGGSFPEIENFFLKVVEFSEFVIGIYFTYLLIPSTLNGFRSFISTGPARINGVSSNYNLAEGRAASYEIGHLKDLLYVCCEQAARNQTRIYFQDFLQDPVHLTPIMVDFLSNNCSTISKDYQSGSYNAKVAYLPWICDFMQVDDSKEFKNALRLVSNRCGFTGNSYGLTRVNFVGIGFDGALSKYFT